jgi:uncharacterized protein (DUF2252 family)
MMATNDTTEPPSELLQQFLAARPTVKERMVAGKALRVKVPRSAHADYSPSPTRLDPVSILEAQAVTRLPQFVPIRHTRMLTSPFAFLRGAAAVMAADLAPTPTTGIEVQACGDMHLSNFGVFGSAERNLVFGINDFDETLQGPWEWDLKRLAASAVVAARFLGADRHVCKESARRVVSAYRTRMREYAQMGYLEVWYAHIDEQAMLAAVSPKVRKGVLQVMAKARTRTHLQVLEKMTDLVDDQHLIREETPFIVRETHTSDGQPIQEALDEFLHGYVPSLSDDRQPLFARYQIVDVARKVVGVGSVGTRCWVILLRGNDRNDPLFLQFKEAEASVLEAYGKNKKSAFECHGQRVVVGQRMIQGAPDIFLGWGKFHTIHYYVRQLRDMKGGVEFDPEKYTKTGVLEYSGLCGWGLALAHAKSGDPALIAGYLGRSEAMDDAIAEFAVAYADQTEQDFEAMATAARIGRIPVAQDSP